MEDEPIKIRHLKLSDIPDAMQLVLAESWNQTEKDWEILIRGSQNICFAAIFDNQLVGTATAINYNNIVSWIGMVLVDKKFRRQGISKLLLKSLFKGLETCKSIKLDATLAGQPIYNKLGFTNEYTIARMVNSSFTNSPNLDLKNNSQQIQTKDIQEIVEFDKQVFGANRKQLIKTLINDFPEKIWVQKEGDKIVGFALGRRGNKHYQIGPVSALSFLAARQLISKVLQNLKGESIVIDILNDKPELQLWLKSIGFEKQRFFTRMFLQNNKSPGKVNSQFLICGPEFG
jgi:GNAT superfamily N-acetyltransferase